MSRRLFALPVLALAASFAPSRPNAEEVGLHQIVLRQLGLAWRRCIEESFAAHWCVWPTKSYQSRCIKDDWCPAHLHNLSST